MGRSGWGGWLDNFDRLLIRVNEGGMGKRGEGDGWIGCALL